MDWAYGAVSTVALTAGLIGFCLIVLNYVWRRDRCLQWFGVSYVFLGIGYYFTASGDAGGSEFPVLLAAILLFGSTAFLLLGACEFANRDPKPYVIAYTGLCGLFLAWISIGGPLPAGAAIVPVILGLFASGALLASTGYLNAICSVPILLRALFLTFDLLAGDVLPVPTPFIANALFVLQAIMLAVAVSARYNLRLERDRNRYQLEAFLDPLTGVLNRRGFQTRVEDYLGQASSRPHAVVMMDIDNFKAINSLFGHTIGDSVLKELANAFQRNLRSGDIFGRIGGEEFAMFLPDADLASAAAIAERLRRQAKLVEAGEGHEISVSFGVAGMEERGSGIDRIHEYADIALKAAKSSGKDCVFVIDGNDKVSHWSGQSGMAAD